MFWLAIAENQKLFFPVLLMKSSELAQINTRHVEKS